jgi:DNA-directed RNA polymerase specialized sigma24 family protein
MNKVIKGTVKELSSRYKDMPDDKIVQQIREGWNGGEALFYLLFGRYADMLKGLFLRFSNPSMDFDDFMLELDIKLFKCDCRVICEYKGDSSFATYLNTIARNLLYDMRKQSMPTIDIDESMFIESYDNSRMTYMIEAINKDPNKDAQFVIFKTLEGYKSKEIAKLLSDKRHEEGTMPQKETLKASYIDTLRSRTLKSIRLQIETMEQEINAAPVELAPPSNLMIEEEREFNCDRIAMMSVNVNLPISSALFFFSQNLSNLFYEMMA